MKTKLMDAGVIMAVILFLSFAPSVFAVEGALGRPISGMQIAPFAGVIPPELGLQTKMMVCVISNNTIARRIKVGRTR